MTPRTKRSPEFIAMRREIRGCYTLEERKERRAAAARLRRAREQAAKPKVVPALALKQDTKTGIWRVAVTLQDTGKKKWISTGEKDEVAARQLVNASGLMRLSMLAKAKCLTADAASIILTGQIITAMDAVVHWHSDLSLDVAKSTARVYRTIVEFMLERSGCLNVPVSKITRQSLYDFVNDPATKHSTRIVRLSALRSFYAHASGYGHVNGNLAATVRINQNLLTVEQRVRTPAVPFTDEEYRCVMSAATTPQFWRWGTALGYWLGLRMIDVCMLEWASVGEDFAVLYPKKTGRRLIMPLHDPLVGSGEMRAIFEEMRAAKTHDTYCFPERKAGYPGIFRTHYCEEYRRVLGACGIAGKTFHGWRHAFRLRMSASGKPIEEVSRLMGHASVDLTLQYGRGAAITEWPSSHPQPASVNSPSTEADSVRIASAG